MSEEEQPGSSAGSSAVVPEVDADVAMLQRAARGAALTRALQAESMATKAPVAPGGLVGLVLATALLFLSSTFLSLGDTAIGNDVSLRDVLLTVILAFTTLWWYGVGPTDPKPAGLCALCALFLLATGGAGLFDPPPSVRAVDVLAAALILLSVLARLGGSRGNDDHVARP